MSGADWLVRLHDIVEHADRAIAYTDRLTYEAFLEDVRTQDAVLYVLLVVGEAAKNVPPEVRERAPDLPWRDAVRLRDRLAHGYMTTDPAAVWSVARVHLVRLRDGVARLAADEERRRAGHPPTG